MQPGGLFTVFGICSLAVVLIASPVFAESPEKDDGTAIASVEIFLNFYKKWVAPTYGPHCPMYPSCSRYSRQAFEKHGLFSGWIMTCDRLLRCGRDESSLAPKIIIEDRIYDYDPLEDNDDWWKR